MAKVVITVRIQPILNGVLREIADAQKTSVSSVIRHALVDRVGAYLPPGFNPDEGMKIEEEKHD